MQPTTAGARFEEYVSRLAAAVGHADREAPMRAYLTGLLLPGDRKSVEPMAARVDASRCGALHQSMHHFVASAPWDDEAVLRVAREWALAAIERHAPVSAWVVDDTSFVKNGSHSVGVARQYCGCLHSLQNCQCAVSVSLANATMSVPAAWRLYLPQEWAADRARRKKAGVPANVKFERKWELVLAQIDRLLGEQLPRAPVVADAGYGDCAEFREALAARRLAYMVGIKSSTTIWGADEVPTRPRRGRDAARRRRPVLRPVPVRGLADDLPADAWQTVTWREGARGAMSARFCALRVKSAHGYVSQVRRRPAEWLLVQWPLEAARPDRWWLSNVTEDAALPDLVALAKTRWRVERDYLELKEEIGLDHYEGRGWLGFHHHTALAIAAYAFLAAERANLSPPSGPRVPSAGSTTPRLPRPRCPQCGRNGMTRPRSRRSARSSPRNSPSGCPPARPADASVRW